MRLVVVRGDRMGRQYVLDTDETVIGRALECDLRLTSPELSRRHALIRRGPTGDCRIEDLGSSNGTFVNGMPVEGGRALNVGDKIQFGRGVVVQVALHDAVHQELTERQRLETLGRLSAGIAHDFNNMLGTVISNVEFLQVIGQETPVGDSEVKATLSDILAAATRAAGLAHRLVAFARGQSRDDGLVDVSDVCREIVRLLRRTFPRRIQVDAQIAPRLRIAGDSLELHQALMNLCLNGRDAMPDYGTLTLAARRDEDNQICITISDDGEGMSPEVQSRIFEPFFTTKGDKGFGLGLASVKETITYLGGQVAVDSQIGRGTSFTLRYPAVSSRAHHDATMAGHQSNDNHAPSESARLPVQVLVVDDEEMVRRSAARVLRRAGHTVDQASSGRIAVNMVRSGAKPDVVLLDVDMPDLDGEEALAQLRALRPEARYVIITGHHDEERERALRERGAQTILHKPWGPGELRDVVESAPPPISEPSVNPAATR
ncbi:MAG: response regulator [Myxococcales bacterium]|nr:response regulator [Myxococcales bacterium]